jgi:hypothetical protein
VDATLTVDAAEKHADGADHVVEEATRWVVLFVQASLGVGHDLTVVGADSKESESALERSCKHEKLLSWDPQVVQV